MSLKRTTNITLPLPPPPLLSSSFPASRGLFVLTFPPPLFIFLFVYTPLSLSLFHTPAISFFPLTTTSVQKQILLAILLLLVSHHSPHLALSLCKLSSSSSPFTTNFIMAPSISSLFFQFSNAVHYNKGYYLQNTTTQLNVTIYSIQKQRNYINKSNEGSLSPKHSLGLPGCCKQ